jgi:hypothetical protein
MRELAFNKSQTARVLRNDEAVAEIEEKPTPLKRLFHGWLREVPPRPREQHTDVDRDIGITRVPLATESDVIARQTPHDLGNAAPLNKKWRILTIRELLGLSRATVRESEAHRTWPPEVVLRFMAAEVVTRKGLRR